MNLNSLSTEELLRFHTPEPGTDAEHLFERLATLAGTIIDLKEEIRELQSKVRSCQGCAAND